ncbi:hypothetical protein K438DRAFT_1793605 [Mycena galopus ATCC 62051]|nr:hypothetical protein K438DRAFT_1793605 [Mycena galopus ATCC 62051]
MSRVESINLHIWKRRKRGDKNGGFEDGAAWKTCEGDEGAAVAHVWICRPGFAGRRTQRGREIVYPNEYGRGDYASEGTRTGKEQRRQGAREAGERDVTISGREGTKARDLDWRGSERTSVGGKSTWKRRWVSSGRAGVAGAKAGCKKGFGGTQQREAYSKPKGAHHAALDWHSGSAGHEEEERLEGDCLGNPDVLVTIRTAHSDVLVSDVPAWAWPESPGLGLGSALKTPKPSPSQAPKSPGFGPSRGFWLVNFRKWGPGLAKFQAEPKPNLSEAGPSRGQAEKPGLRGLRPKPEHH